MDSKILSSIFDEEMLKSIQNFSRIISETKADYYIVMARKASCFLEILEKLKYIYFNGKVYTDRILDTNLVDFREKSIVIIDDVVVSGTTIYGVLEKVKALNAAKVDVYVLGVNKEYYCKDLFSYYNNEIEYNYVKGPYILMSDEGCTKTCSNIASLFSLFPIPYDVDFPRHVNISATSFILEKILSFDGWISYDVSSKRQFENDIINSTLLPSEQYIEKIERLVNLPLRRLGHLKIRVLAKKTNKSKEYSVSITPYFLFSEISNDTIESLFTQYFFNEELSKLTDIAKLRLLQYIISEKIYRVWLNEINIVLHKNYISEIDKKAFSKIFPIDIYQDVLEAIEYNNVSLYINDITPKIQMIETASLDNENISLPQTELIKPFSKLYFEKELDSRRLVKEYGKEAFKNPKYKNTIDRLKEGYSYYDLISLLNNFSDVDKETTVSIFIDESIDAGIIVPIIAKKTINNTIFYYRAFRHGEDIPFGEHHEKLCSILLKGYLNYGDENILSKLRVEKILVLFLRIGENQKIFNYIKSNTIFYKVNIDAYIFGNVPTIQSVDIKDNRRIRYLKYKSEASWLTDILSEKGILETKDGKYNGINDNINISIDENTRGKVDTIAQTFALLYLNEKKGILPGLSDNDLVMLSTCLFPIDVLNALAAELAIFESRWSDAKNYIFKNEADKSYNMLKTNDLYTSINSGQLKYYNFVERKAILKIKEISLKLHTNREYSIYGAAWDQFWPTNYEWDMNSLDASLLQKIHLEGKLILIFNLLVRCILYYLTIQDKEKMLFQINDYTTKLEKCYYGNNQDVIEVISYVKEHYNSFNFELIIHLIDKYTKQIRPVLQDAELLVGKHGKISKIYKYNFAVHIKTKRNNDNDNFGSNLTSVLNKLKIKHKMFVIKHPTDVFYSNGIYVFINSGILNIINFIKSIYKYDINFVQHIKVFCYLSDDLNFKESSDIESKYIFGDFPNYLSIADKQIENLDNNKKNVSTFWIVQKYGKNQKNVENKIKIYFKKTYTNYFNYESVKSSESSIICTSCDIIEERLIKYRMEYKKMGKRIQIFISYTNDNSINMQKIETIVDRLKNENFDVKYYEDEPLGTDLISFMRNIQSSDITLIMGTRAYMNQVKISENGAGFEDHLLASMFMSQDRNKIVPIMLEPIKESIPKPFDTMKGMSFEDGITDEKLNVLVTSIIAKYKRDNQL